MQNRNARHEEPPRGGIFLSPELVIPDHIISLIQALPELEQSSHFAKSELDRLFKDQYDRPFDEPDLYAQYIAQTREVIEKPELMDTEQGQYICYVDGLTESAGQFEDAWSAIARRGERVAGFLGKILPLGHHNIGNHQYEMTADKRQRRMLCGFDEVASLNVYYNYWEDIKGSGARLAYLSDYVKLMNDLIYERAAIDSRPQYGSEIIKAESIDFEEAQQNREKQEARRLANGAFAYAYCFWLNHNDLFVKDLGRIMDITLEDTRYILYFDARRKDEGFYTWQLKNLYANTLDECDVTQNSVVCRRYAYDAQRRTREVAVNEPYAVHERIITIAEHEATKRNIYELRQKHEAARREVGAFALKAATEPINKPYNQTSPPQYVSELDKQQHKLYAAMFPNESGSVP